MHTVAESQVFVGIATDVEPEWLVEYILVAVRRNIGHQNRSRLIGVERRIGERPGGFGERRSHVRNNY